MKLLDVVGSVSDLYLEETQKPEKVSEYAEALTPNIRPSEIYVYGGEGAELRTNKGRLLDLSSMTVNTVLGQNDPWVKAHMIAYLLSNRPSFLSTRFGSEFYYLLANRLKEVCFVDDAVVNHRQCNGSDVTELAIVSAYAARENPSRNTLLSFKGSYHGQNLTSYLASDLQRENIFWIKPEDVKVNFLDVPESESSKSEEEVLGQIDSVRDKLFGVILEPFQVNNNLYCFSKDFLSRLKTMCEKANISLIFDEIQSGFGWLGTVSAAESIGVKPNVMAVSKGITGGFGPLAAIIANSKYQNIPYGTGEKTNGADMRSLVAANAVLDRLLGLKPEAIPNGLPIDLQEELKRGLLAYVPEKAQILDQLIEYLEFRFPEDSFETKGQKMIRGLKFADEKKLDLAYKKLLENGVYVRKSRQSLIIKPPLTITREQITEAVEKIEKVLKMVLQE